MQQIREIIVHCDDTRMKLGTWVKTVLNDNISRVSFKEQYISASTHAIQLISEFCVYKALQRALSNLLFQNICCHRNQSFFLHLFRDLFHNDVFFHCAE